MASALSLEGKYENVLRNQTVARCIIVHFFLLMFYFRNNSFQTNYDKLLVEAKHHKKLIQSSAWDSV